MDPEVLDDEFKVENSVYPKAALVTRQGKEMMPIVLRLHLTSNLHSTSIQNTRETDGTMKPVLMK